MEGCFPVSRRNWGLSNCSTFFTASSLFFLNWNILLHLFCFQYFIIEAWFQICYSTMSTSNRVDLQPVYSLFSPATFSTEAHLSVSGSALWYSAFCWTLQCFVYLKTLRPQKKKYIFCFMMRTGMMLEINPLILEHFTALVQYFVWTYLECYENRIHI